MGLLRGSHYHNFSNQCNKDRSQHHCCVYSLLLNTCYYPALYHLQEKYD